MKKENETDGGRGGEGSRAKGQAAVEEGGLPAAAGGANSPQLHKTLVWACVLLMPMTRYTLVYAIVKKSVVTTSDLEAYRLWYPSPVPMLGRSMAVTAWIPKVTHEARKEAGYKYRCEGEERPEYSEIQWDDGTLERFLASPGSRTWLPDTSASAAAW